MKLIELIQTIDLDTNLDPGHLFEMANIREKDSGLPMTMFVSSKQYVGGRHGPRLKVSNLRNKFSADDNFVVILSKDPVIGKNAKYKESELNTLMDWVKLNLNTLLKYWNDEYESDADFLLALKKL